MEHAWVGTLFVFTADSFGCSMPVDPKCDDFQIVCTAPLAKLPKSGASLQSLDQRRASDEGFIKIEMLD